MGVKIFWAVVTGFLLGVLLRSFFQIGLSFVGLAALCAFAALAVGHLLKKDVSGAVVIAVAIISFGLGIVRMDTAVLVGDPILTPLIDSRITIEGIVVAEPDVRESNILLQVSVDSLVVGSSTIAVDAGVLVSVLPHTPVSYGDRISAIGLLRLPEAFDAGEGRQFHYPEYLAVSGISYQLKNAEIEVLSRQHGNAAKAAAIYAKHLYIAGLHRSLPEPQAGLAAGITVGDKRSVGPELSEIFRKVSLIHIIVLSGYNISIVISSISYLTSGLPRMLNAGISGFVVLFFILMTGGTASAMRAGVMALIAIYARLTGRVFIAARALAAFALVLVASNPYHLAFDPSFQLSVLATLGLIFITPIASGYLWWITERIGLREIAASTIGTQLAVLPLLLYQNGQLSIVSLPANLLALVPTPIAMFFSFVAALGGMLGPLAPIVGFPAYVLLSYVIAVAEIFGSMPFAALSVPAFSPIIMFVVYTILALLVARIRKTPLSKAGPSNERTFY